MNNHRHASAGPRIHGAALCALLGLNCALATAQTPQTFRQLIQEGQRYRSLGNARAASSKYAAAVEASGNDQERAEALTVYATTLRQLRQDDKAEAALREAVALDIPPPFRRAAMFQLATLLEMDDRIDEAVDLYADLAEKNSALPPEAADALIAAARLLVRDEQYERAIELLTGVPRDGIGQHQKQDTANLLIESLIGLGQLDAANEAIEAMNADARVKAGLYVRIARVLFGQERDVEARAACDAALTADPSSQVAWRTVYEIAERQGTSGELAAELQAQLEETPDDDALIERMAAMAEWSDDADGALAVYRRLTELRPDDANVFERAGSLATDAGRHDEALEFYQAALALQPGDLSIHYMMGDAYAAAGNGDAAVKAWKKGTSFRLGDLSAAQRLGAVLTQNSLPEQALAVYEEHREATGEPRALATDVARVLAALGRTGDAIREYVAASSESIDTADTVALSAINVARSAKLLPELETLARDGLAVSGAPGLALLLALAEAEQGRSEGFAERAVAAGLTADDLMTIGEALEYADHADAASRVYGAVVDHPQVSEGLRLEIGLRSAQLAAQAHHPDAALETLRKVTESGRGPATLHNRAMLLMADLMLASGEDLHGARGIFGSLLSASPDIALKSRWRLADCAFAAGDLDEAEALYRRLREETKPTEIRMPPAPPGMSVQMPPGIFPALGVFREQASDPRMTPAYAAWRIAECAFRKHDLDQARALFVDVATNYPDSIYANDAMDRRLFIVTHFRAESPAAEAYLQALTRGRSDGWQDALLALRDMAAKGGGEPLADDAALLAAQLLEAHGEFGDAAESYRSVVTDHSSSLLAPEALLGAARASYMAGDDMAAKKDLEDLTRNFPASPMAQTAALWLDDLQGGRHLSAASR